MGGPGGPPPGGPGGPPGGPGGPPPGGPGGPEGIPPTGAPPSGGLRECPEAWYKNQMPTVGPASGPPPEYFIVGGKRRELREYDLPWVIQTCGLTPQSVQ